MAAQVVPLSMVNSAGTVTRSLVREVSKVEWMEKGVVRVMVRLES